MLSFLTTSRTVDSLPRLMIGLAWTSTVSWTRCLPRLIRSGDRKNGSELRCSEAPIAHRGAATLRHGSDGPGERVLDHRTRSAGRCLSRRRAGASIEGARGPWLVDSRKGSVGSWAEVRLSDAGLSPSRRRCEGAWEDGPSGRRLTLALAFWEAGAVEVWARIVDDPPTASRAAIARNAAAQSVGSKWRRRRSLELRQRSGVESIRPIMETVPSPPGNNPARLRAHRSLRRTRRADRTSEKATVPGLITDRDRSRKLS